MDSAVDRHAGKILKMRHFVALLLCSCVYEWNGDQPVFPLTGNAPPLSSFTQLNQVVAGRPSLMTGPDGVNWLAFCEFWATGNGNSGARCGKLRLVRLGLPGDAPAEELISADAFSLQDEELYVMRDDDQAMTRTVTLHRPGDDPSLDVPFTFRQGKALLYANPDDAGVFVYWIMDDKTDSLSIYRRDQKFQRNLPLPSGVDPTKTPDPEKFDFVFTGDGSRLVWRTDDGTMTAFSTLDESTVQLGNHQADFTIDDTLGVVLTFADGIESVPLDGSPAKILSTAAIDFTTFSLTDTAAWWSDSQGLWQVPLDGSTPAQLAQPGGARLWTLGPQNQITYSKESRQVYAGGAGSGWVGDWNFMERGRLIAWSSDGARIHFLEHAATVGTYGDLTSVSVPNGAPRTLAINAHNWAELPDHRILAVENAVYSGTWNRLVVIDEVANTKHWVVPECADFFLINNGTELIADVVSGASGFNILRVPAP